MNNIEKMYVELKKSIPEISSATGIPRSTIRFQLKALGALRSRAESVRLAGEAGRLGSGLRGKKREFTPEWCARISASKLKASELTAISVSLKPSGYVEYTRGPNKGRCVHVVAMEKTIGRRLFNNECVHHRDENKSNNEISNLQLMTKSEHARLHALINVKNRDRNKNGQFE